MPVRSLSDAEIERLTTWPPELARSDLAAHFTLGLDDLRWIRSFRGAGNRPAWANPRRSQTRCFLRVREGAPRDGRS